ncbi:MAG: hypothetical protein J6U95_03405 [Alistipes sp.]|nr:hypothetical protein [Alistipes sp.]
MGLFSERYGYKKVSDVIIREKITPEIQNAICSCFDELLHIYSTKRYPVPSSELKELEKHVWTKFFNQRLSNYNYNSFSIPSCIEDTHAQWYEVLDLIEFSIKYMHHRDESTGHSASIHFVALLNSEFERLNFAYRIVNYEIVEITSEQEIKAIEKAIESSPQNVKMHLNSALEKLAQRPDGDYRNSIKESISAVEAFCREKTGESTLGRALNSLERNNIIIHSQLKSAFEKLYAYTNHPETGIRHCSMDNEGRYTPTADEALFMLVSCSTFINYLSKKVQ